MFSNIQWKWMRSAVPGMSSMSSAWKHDTVSFFLQPLQRLCGFLDPAWLMAQKSPSWEFTEICASKTLNCLLVREKRKLKQQKVHQIVFCKLEPEEVQFRKYLPACLDLSKAGVSHSTGAWMVLFYYHNMIHDLFYSFWVCVLGYETRLAPPGSRGFHTLTSERKVEQVSMETSWCFFHHCACQCATNMFWHTEWIFTKWKLRSMKGPFHPWLFHRCSDGVE